MLRFRPDGTFTIVQFTDTHFKNGEPEDNQTSELMHAVLAAEQPDLVMFTGDVIDGGHCSDPAASWRRALAPVVAHELPWAAVFGNHDDEGTMDRAQLMAVQQTIPGCLSQPGPDDCFGVGNYVLPVASAQSDRTAAHLYCVDSNAYAPTGIGGYGWIRRDQIAWYLAAAAGLRAQNGDVALPALAFLHIPLPEYNEVWDRHPCVGVKYEPICSPRVNTGFFAALHEAGDVTGVFVGHDHINDFSGELYGIRLSYGRGTGYNTYGCEEMARGARVSRLVEGQHGFTTWLRLAGDGVVTQQPPHAPEGTRSLPAWPLVRRMAKRGIRLAGLSWRAATTRKKRTN